MYCFCPSAFLIREKSLVGSDGKRRSDPSTAKRRYPRKVIVGIADETKSLNIISTALERILLRCWTNAEAVAVLGVYPNQSYDLRFRVVRFRISGGCNETVYTNLDSETFPIGKIKELYRLRWGIETSFRELKYTIGLSCLHGKKTDFLLQEVFARLILYNYASLIARKIPVPQEKQINFSVAILVCKQFLKGKIRSAQIFEILSKHLSPIRPGRQYKRYQNPVSAVAFQYRFS